MGRGELICSVVVSDFINNNFPTCVSDVCAAESLLYIPPTFTDSYVRLENPDSVTSK